MKKIISIVAAASLLLGFFVGCQETDLVEPQAEILGDGYRPFPQDSADIPDPDTLTEYPYDPNLYIPYDFSSLNLTEYPEPDTSQIDFADQVLMIPKADFMIPLQDFLDIERAILPETTLQRLADSIYIVPQTSMTMTSYTNDCPFDFNQRGDVLLVRSPWVPVPGFFKHVGVWLGSLEDGYSKEMVHSVADGVKYVSASAFHYWKRCTVMRVECWPYNDSYYRDVAADYCELQVDKPYNYNWLWKYTQRKFYCSQLAWAGYWYGGDKLIDIDIYCIHYIPQFGFVPDFHVAPDEIWIDWRTFVIARSSGNWGDD